VNLEAFVRARQGAWTELDGLVRRARGRPERLGADGVRRLGELYRGAVADLARGRCAAPTDPAVRSLEELVGRARATIYVAPTRRGGAAHYLRFGYWQSVRRHGRVVLLAWALLLGAAVLAAVWASHDPGAATGVVPGSIAGAGGGPDRAIGLAAGQSAALSVSIFTNNIGVTFMSFASGIVFGIAPAFFLLYNGLLLGAVTGIGTATSHGTDVLELITPHGMLELSCIAVSAAAGMRMGWALVEPGSRGRLAALAHAAPEAVLLVLATAPWLVLAGLVEGFVTPHHLPLPAAVAIGVGLAAPYWACVALLGRNRQDTAQHAPAPRGSAPT
jgi:uncharacterized membrane protein SpoIIM required for sporulation